MKRICLFLLICVLGLFQTVGVANAVSTDVAVVPDGDDSAVSERYDRKVYCDATIEEEFTDDIILIVLDKVSSMRESFTASDFGTDFSGVEDLSVATFESVKKRLTAEKSEDRSGTNNGVDNDISAEVRDFRRVLSLELKNPGKENVLTAIKKLEKKAEVLSAIPNFIGTLDAVPTDQYYTRGDQWAINRIALPSAWDISKGMYPDGKSVVTVAVLDSGVDGTHPDLTNRLDRNLCYDFVNRLLNRLPFSYQIRPILTVTGLE